MTVRIIEVGPRDGLQNEAVPVSTEDKCRFIRSLFEAGLREIEITSFVSPLRVPQLADADDLWTDLPKGGLYSALVPNAKGAVRAAAVGLKRVALFTAASDEFNLRNIGMDRRAAKEAMRAVLAELPNREWTRVYISTAFECPFKGKMPPKHVAEMAAELCRDLKADEISLGDTIGTAAPREVRLLHDALNSEFGGDEKRKVAWHFHATWGTGIANVQAAIDLGYGAFDASAGGLGGCPFAPGAGGNIATEDLVYILERSGISTGVDLERLAAASLSVLRTIGKPVAQHAQAASVSRARQI